MGTGSVPRGYNGRGVALTTHPHPTPRLKKEQNYTSTPFLCLHGRSQGEFYLSNTRQRSENSRVISSSQGMSFRFQAFQIATHNVHYRIQFEMAACVNHSNGRVAGMQITAVGGSCGRRKTRWRVGAEWEGVLFRKPNFCPKRDESCKSTVQPGIMLT